MKVECVVCGKEFEISSLELAEKFGQGPDAENANPERRFGPWCPECEEGMA